MLDINLILSLIVWTVCGTALLALLMFADSRFTRYNDLDEIKQGNMAVTTRFVLKLLAQAYILSSSIAATSSLPDALGVSVISFVLLLAVEGAVRRLLSRWGGIALDHGTTQGKVGYGLVSGALHMAGALIIGAYI